MTLWPWIQECLATYKANTDNITSATEWDSKAITQVTINCEIQYYTVPNTDRAEVAISLLLYMDDINLYTKRD